MSLNVFRDEVAGFLRAVDPDGGRTDGEILAMLDEKYSALTRSESVPLSHRIYDTMFLLFELAAVRHCDLDAEWEAGRTRKRKYLPGDPQVPGPLTAIAPMLSVRHGADAVAFYKAAFGAEEMSRIENEAGEVVARLSAGGAEFWVADESPEHLNFSPESLGGGSVRMVMIVDDPDAAFDRAVAAGATAVRPVGERHGWREGRVVDPFGYHWEIGRPSTPGR
jgi:PhnB protein